MKRMINSSKFNMIKSFTLDDVLNIVNPVDDINIQDSTGRLYSGKLGEFNIISGEDDNFYALLHRNVDMIRPYNSVLIILLDD